jgi:hypothetical protein
MDKTSAVIPPRFPSVSEGPANQAWGHHVDTCKVCPTLPDDWCPEGSRLLDAAVAECKLDEAVAEANRTRCYRCGEKVTEGRVYFGAVGPFCDPTLRPCREEWLGLR